mmetsp:Transcript_93782/g.235467  ORF Transcript_93782/g.235467 Transcript_93782/m.235467 type:complete len:211 (+) Transcript_93782:1767-2399(+)
MTPPVFAKSSSGATRPRTGSCWLRTAATCSAGVRAAVKMLSHRRSALSSLSGLLQTRRSIAWSARPAMSQASWAVISTRGTGSPSNPTRAAGLSKKASRRQQAPLLQASSCSSRGSQRTEIAWTSSLRRWRVWCPIGVAGGSTSTPAPSGCASARHARAPRATRLSTSASTSALCTCLGPTRISGGGVRPGTGARSPRSRATACKTETTC